jgi:hypothetical protein
MARATNGKISTTVQRLIAVEKRLGTLDTTVRTEIGATNARLDVMTIRLDQMLRVLEAIAEHLNTALELRPRVDDLDRRLAVLESRGGAS